jgi:hypothetical protein
MTLYLNNISNVKINVNLISVDLCIIIMKCGLVI